MSLIADLAPQPGRLRDAVTIGGMCTAIVVLFMTLRIPEAGLAAYLVFFAYRADANGTIAVAVVFSLLSVIVVALAVPLIGLVIDAPLARMALVAAITFAGMWAASATALGPIASTLAMLLTFLLILPDVVDAPIPDEVALLVRGIVWLVPMVVAAMAVIALGALLFGRKSLAVLSDRLQARIATAADRLDGRIDADAFAEAVAAAPGLVEEMKPFARLGAPRGRFDRLLALDAATLDLMLAVAALDEAETDPAVRAALAARLRAGRAPSPPPPADPVAAAAAGEVAAATEEIAALLAGGPVRRTIPKADGGFLKEGALHDPRHRRFALQVTIAAMACIAFFTGLQWVSIHTCLITCYYVSEATLGESLHKMTLRIVGALIGAAIAVGAIVFLVPRMTGVGELAILVFLVATLGGWIAVGPERVAYAGFQITLAFFLVVLESFGTFGPNFGPSFDLEPATGRILGILVGNLACAFVFLTLWPAPMRGDVARLLAETWERVAAGLAGAGPIVPAALLPRVSRACDLFDYVRFESGPAEARLGPAWRSASGRTLRLLAVSRCLARRRERLGRDGPAAPDGLARAVAAGAAALRRGEPAPPRAAPLPPAPPPADPLDRALVERLREIACPAPAPPSSSCASPALSPAA